MSTDLKVKEVKPLFTSVVTTMNKYEDDFYEGALIKYKAGEVKMYQTVVAVGDMVRCVQPGDIVIINPNNYIVKQHDPNSVKSDMVMNKVVSYDVPTVEIDGIKHLALQDRDIRYIVTKYEEVESSIPTSTGGPTLIIPKPNLSI